MFQHPTHSAHYPRPGSPRLQLATSSAGNHMRQYTVLHSWRWA